ncbi:MAG TPA: PIG-L deacetylase family protein [Candidatus Acidoferrum sp.]|nr:PIG-L deacetylase family protein [Candidatus Acidoferrum sp.]
MRILAIGAHPDDIEFGCGGTLSKYARQGHEVSLLVMTDGAGGGEVAIRRREQAMSAHILQASKVFWGEYPDTAIPLDRVLIQRVEGIIQEVKPEFIFVHYGDDTHQDHRNLSTSTVTATRYTRNVLFYEGPTTQNFSPSVFVDIASALEEKIASLQAHGSQVCKTNIEGLSIVDIARSSAHFRGIQGRVRDAEGFVPLRLFINIHP